MQDCKYQANKRSIVFCPFCGLIADNTQKGVWVICYHCEAQVIVFMKSISVNSWGESRVEDACIKKVRYHSLTEAVTAYREIADRERHTHTEMRVYLCEICGMLHLGHDPRHGVKSRSWAIEEAEVEIQAMIAGGAIA